MSPETIQALGWSLVHFLWQGALVALFLELGLQALRERSARARYAVRCAALGLMALLPVATFVWLRATGTGPAATPEDPRALLALLEAAERGAGPMSWLVAGWALGAAACAARVLVGWVRIRGLQRSSAGAPLPLTWQLRFDHLARRMGTRAAARVIDSAALAAPTVIGWLKPVVLIPARALSGLSTEQLEAVLAHELAHVRRHDYLVNLVQSALEALLFYHPAVWWVSNGIRAEREFCCDDEALAVSSDGVVYARALATLEGWRSAQPQFGLSTLGGPLMTRIQRLIGIHPASRPARTPLTAMGALLLLGSATVWAHGQPDPDGGQDPDQLRAIREHLDDVQARLDELRAMLDEAAPASASWTSEEDLYEQLGGEPVEWVVKGDEGERYSVILKQKAGSKGYDEKPSGAEGHGGVYVVGEDDELVELELPEAGEAKSRVRVFVKGKDGRLESADASGYLKGVLQGTDGKAWWSQLEGEHGEPGLFGKLKLELDEDDKARLHEHLMKLRESGDLDLETLHGHLMKLHERKLGQGEHASKLEQLHGKLAKLMHGKQDSGSAGQKHRVQRFEFDDGTPGEVRVEVIVGDDESPFGNVEVHELKRGGKVKVYVRGGEEADVQVLELDQLPGKARYLELDPSKGEHHEFFFQREDEADGDEGGAGAFYGKLPKGAEGNHFFFRGQAGDGEDGAHYLFRGRTDDDQQGRLFLHRGTGGTGGTDGAAVKLNELRALKLPAGELKLRSSPGTYRLTAPKALKLRLGEGTGDCDAKVECEVEVEVDCDVEVDTAAEAKPGQIV